MSQDRASVAVLKQAYPRNACGACFDARACIVRIHAAESQHWNSMRTSGAQFANASSRRISLSEHRAKDHEGGACSFRRHHFDF